MRPISCVNLIYNFIAKILASRLMEVADGLLYSKQTAFMPGRFIADNTLLTDEMLNGFGRARTPGRVCLSVDLKKAFDSVKWDTTNATFQAMGFSSFRNLTSNCIKSSFLLSDDCRVPYNALQKSKRTAARGPHIPHSFQLSNGCAKETHPKGG